jgi:hypothetical protein
MQGAHVWVGQCHTGRPDRTAALERRCFPLVGELVRPSRKALPKATQIEPAS